MAAARQQRAGHLASRDGAKAGRTMASRGPCTGRAIPGHPQREVTRGLARCRVDTTVRPEASSRSKRTHTRAAFPLRPDGALRVVVVADTHSRPDPRSAGIIAARKPDRILHAGDIGAPGVLDALAVHAPV